MFLSETYYASNAGYTEMIQNIQNAEFWSHVMVWSCGLSIQHVNKWSPSPRLYFWVLVLKLLSPVWQAVIWQRAGRGSLQGILVKTPITRWHGHTVAQSFQRAVNVPLTIESSAHCAVSPFSGYLIPIVYSQSFNTKSWIQGRIFLLTVTQHFHNILFLPIHASSVIFRTLSATNKVTSSSWSFTRWPPSLKCMNQME